LRITPRGYALQIFRQNIGRAVTVQHMISIGSRFAGDIASRKQLTLVACILGSGIALLDGTAVNVALPTIQHDLGGGLAAQQWVVNAYLLTLGSLILIGGSLGDLYGERRIFALGVSGFGVASLLCALAPTIGALIAARALQGVGGALMAPGSVVYDLVALASGGVAAGGIFALERRRYLESRSRVSLAPERFLDLLALRHKRKIPEIAPEKDE